MAVSKGGAKAPRKTAPRITRPLKPETVTVGSELREKYKWFDGLAEEALLTEIEKRRAEKKKDGPKLSPRRLESVLGQLERLQRQLNPLEKRKNRLVKRLVAHWGHTGERELTDTLGNTLISTSATMGMIPDVVRKNLGEEEWVKLLVSVMKLDYLLIRADGDEKLRAHIKDAITVNQLKVNVTPPSSRRPKSGEPNDE